MFPNLILFFCLAPPGVAASLLEKTISSTRKIEGTQAAKTHISVMKVSSDSDQCQNIMFARLSEWIKFRGSDYLSVFFQITTSNGGSDFGPVIAL